MALCFIDTSALVRRYDRGEVGSDRIRSICSRTSDNTLLISRITPVEVASALVRKTREGVLDVERRDALWQLFLVHWRRQYHAVTVDEEAFREAHRLVLAYPLRAYDAIQIGCALRVVHLLARTEQPLRFLTADRPQSLAAQSEGLEVELIGR